MSPQSTPLAYILHSAGPASRPVFILGWALTALCVGVCVVIAVLLLIAVLRRRPSIEESGASGEAITEHGGGRAVLIGTLISTALLLAALVYMLWVPRGGRIAVARTGADHHRYRVRLVVESRLWRERSAAIYDRERNSHSRRRAGAG